MLTQRSSFVSTPIGTLEITATERGITTLSFVEKPGKSDETYAHLRACSAQIAEYFDGKRTAFSDLPLAIVGTAFNQDVWEIVSRVPYGKTMTYGDVAEHLHRRGAARAVGGAVGSNVLAIIIPCHRIVAADARGEAGGYAWGEERKKWLLDLEKRKALS